MLSKQIAAIPLNSIERIAIVFGNGRSMAQVKGTADYIMNAGFYDMTRNKPVGHLKANGTVYVRENWDCWSFTWDTAADIRMDKLPENGASNYVHGVELLMQGLGPGAALFYGKDYGGKRGRSAMMLAGDKLVLYCTGDGTKDAKTPEGVRDELVEIGSRYADADSLRAVGLDSGGSSQCDFRGETINSSRRVNNYIAVWLKKTGDNPKEGEESMEKKKVVLDPGHGVETAGKRSPDGTYLEHEFALIMALRLKAILERHGVEVTLTRSDERDVGLTKRARISNEVGPDLFVSLHSNAAGSGAEWMSVRGYGIYTSGAGDTKGRNIAAKAILARAKEAGLTLWGGGLHHSRLTVLTETDDPAVLIEHLFHDNREDAALLKDGGFRALLAQVDAKGILDYLGIAWVDEPATEAEGADSGFSCPHCGGGLKIEKG